LQNSIKNKIIRTFLNNNLIHFSDYLASLKNEDKTLFIDTVFNIIEPIIKNIDVIKNIDDWDTKNDLFDRIEEVGYHLLPVHYYSPIPSKQELLNFDFNKSPYNLAYDFKEKFQLELLNKFARYNEELYDIPIKQQREDEYAWENPAFWPFDAIVYYSFIREFKPSVVVEVGSGYSSLMAAKALVENKKGMLKCVEPYPYEFLKKGFKGLTNLIEKRVQDVDVDVFMEMKKNDILFIDNTHVCKTGSDVNYLILEILPILNPGVIIHFHDIYLPYEYPKSWLIDKKLFWNEQYLLNAFMMFNNSFEVMLTNFLIGRKHVGKFKNAFPCIANYAEGGGSFWIRKIK